MGCEIFLNRESTGITPLISIESKNSADIDLPSYKGLNYFSIKPHTSNHNILSQVLLRSQIMHFIIHKRVIFSKLLTIQHLEHFCQGLKLDTILKWKAFQKILLLYFNSISSLSHVKIYREGYEA